MFIQSTEEMFTKCFSLPPCNHERLGIQGSKEKKKSWALVQKENWLMSRFKDYKIPPGFQTHISNVKTNHVCVCTLNVIQQWLCSTNKRIHHFFNNTIMNQLTKHN